MNSDLEFHDSVKQYLFDIGYKNIEVLGHGGFGDVLAATSPDDTEVAIKIITNEASWPMEEYIWPLLRHENILPVLHVMKLDHLDCKLYVMKKHPATLMKIIRERDFQNDPNAFLRMKRWFVDILKGLENMHKAEFCHLDLKSDNVLVSSEDTAIICDFSGVNFTGINIERLVAPVRCRPPECYSENGGEKIEGVRYDMWSFGLLALNCLTGFWPSRNMGKVNSNWSFGEKVKPVICKSLQEIVFNQLLHKAFPSVRISKRDSTKALDFLKALLSFDPQQRPTASEAMKHPFLEEASSTHLSGKERLEFKKFEREPAFDQEGHVIHPFSDKEQKMLNGGKPVLKFGKNLFGVIDKEKSSSDVQVISVHLSGRKHLGSNKFESGKVFEQEDNAYHSFSTILNDGEIKPNLNFGKKLSRVINIEKSSSDVEVTSIYHCLSFNKVESGGHFRQAEKVCPPLFEKVTRKRKREPIFADEEQRRQDASTVTSVNFGCNVNSNKRAALENKEGRRIMRKGKRDENPTEKDIVR